MRPDSHQRPVMWLICGPGSFSPLSTWEAHVRSLRSIEDKDENVFGAIRHARDHIRWIKREGLVERLSEATGCP